MGWSYSDDANKLDLWREGIATFRLGCVVGRSRTTTSGANYSVVFMANLAMPASKFPAGGVHGYVNTETDEAPYVGGGCIAKSTDGGKTFANYQCVSNTQPIEGVPDSSQGHFYDGGSMASNRAGEVFIAYVDVAASTADVYRSPNSSGIFAPIPTPFPGLTVASHVRLRTGPDNSLYAAAQVSGSDGGLYVYLNRYFNGSWGRPVQASNNCVLYPAIDFGTTAQGSD